MNIGVRAEENKRVDCVAEFHAEGRKVARVEIERVCRCESHEGTVTLGPDLGQGLFLDCKWTSGLCCDGLGFAECDGRYTAWKVNPST